MGFGRQVSRLSRFSRFISATNISRRPLIARAKSDTFPIQILCLVGMGRRLGNPRSPKHTPEIPDPIVATLRESETLGTTGFAGI